MKLHRSELIVPLVVAGFGATYLSTVQGLPRESVVFPVVVLIALAVTGVLALWREAVDGVEEAPPRHVFATGELNKPSIVFLSAIGYLVLFNYAGFVIAALAFMFVVMVALGTRLHIAACASLAITGGLYLLFAKLFYVDL
jgi:hypothetical protein